MPADVGTHDADGPDRSGDTGFDDLRDIDRLVHEPARLMVLGYLYVTDGADFTFLARHVGLTFGNLSSHIAKLEDAGYVQVEKTFKGKRPHTLIRLTAQGRSAFTLYRERMERALRDLSASTAPRTD
jgi:DNA-binding MarR family transcriptional regulator